MRHTFIIPGEPRGKGRPKFVRATGRTYTPSETVSAENAVRGAWQDAGSPQLGDVPVEVRVVCVFARPKAHFKKDGGFTSLGRRSLAPTKKPDADNVLKLVTDALNKLAYRDDSQVVQASVSKRWAASMEVPHIRVEVCEFSPLGLAAHQEIAA